MVWPEFATSSARQLLPGPVDGLGKAPQQAGAIAGGDGAPRLGRGGDGRAIAASTSSALDLLDGGDHLLGGGVDDSSR